MAPKLDRRKSDDRDRTRGDERLDDRDDDNRFSQRDDDRAGRSWHGMNSDYELEDTGRFHPDEDDDDTSAAATPRLDTVLQRTAACGS